MTDTFDYSGLAAHVRAIALPHHASDVLRTRIEAAFVPLHRYETVYAVAAEQGLACDQATARAEAAEAENARLREALRRIDGKNDNPACFNADINDIVMKALGAEHGK